MDNLPPRFVYEVQDSESLEKTTASAGAAYVPPSNPSAASSTGSSGPGAPAHGSGAPACAVPSAAASSAAAGRCQHADAASTGGEPSPQTSEVTLPPLPVKVGEDESGANSLLAGMLSSVFCSATYHSSLA